MGRKPPEAESGEQEPRPEDTPTQVPIRRFPPASDVRKQVRQNREKHEGNVEGRAVEIAKDLLPGNPCQQVELPACGRCRASLQQKPHNITRDKRDRGGGAQPGLAKRLFPAIGIARKEQGRKHGPKIKSSGLADEKSVSDRRAASQNEPCLALSEVRHKKEDPQSDKEQKGDFCHVSE